MEKNNERVKNTDKRLCKPPVNLAFHFTQKKKIFQTQN